MHPMGNPCWGLITEKSPKMATISGDSTSKWTDLPTDVLASIADRLDREIGIGILRLRSICRSWRSSLSTFLQPSINFPLKLPLPPSYISSSLPPPLYFSLRQQTVYLLSNGRDRSFLIKVEQRGHEPNIFSLHNPLSKHARLSKPMCILNLLDYRISLVCKSYIADSSADFRIQKVVVGLGFFNKGDFVVLGLKYDGGLLIWRYGDVSWTEIVAPGRCFDDVISFDGKFYATADKKGRLVMIDSRLQPIDLVPKLMYGDGTFSNLVECNGNLYLVDREADGDEPSLRLGVFKLDDKGCFWDYELDLNGCVFFLGDDTNFALSRKDYNGCVTNVIFFKNNFGDDGFTLVFDTKYGFRCCVADNEDYDSLYWPPRGWFN